MRVCCYSERSKQRMACCVVTPCTKLFRLSQTVHGLGSGAWSEKSGLRKVAWSCRWAEDGASISPCLGQGEPYLQFLHLYLPVTTSADTIADTRAWGVQFSDFEQAKYAPEDSLPPHVPAGSGMYRFLGLRIQDPAPARPSHADACEQHTSSICEQLSPARRGSAVEAGMSSAQAMLGANSRWCSHFVRDQGQASFCMHVTASGGP